MSSLKVHFLVTMAPFVAHELPPIGLLISIEF
jgi:hypothetical protein